MTLMCHCDVSLNFMWINNDVNCLEIYNECCAGLTNIFNLFIFVFWVTYRIQWSLLCCCIRYVRVKYDPICVIYELHTTKFHDDVIKWKHFRVTEGQWHGVLICVWINGWVNDREAGDLRRYRARYDVTVMLRALRYKSSYAVLKRLLVLLTKFAVNLLAYVSNHCA